MHALVGTPIYVAPEVIDGEYDFKCDVWSLGVVFHHLITGTAPFLGNNDNIFDKIKNQ